MLKKSERGIVLDMEKNIDRVKSFSDVLMSTCAADQLPDSNSLYEVASILYLDAKDLQEKYTELCNSFHEAPDEEEETTDLYPHEVMELVGQIENGNKSMIDVVYEAFLLGVAMESRKH